MQTRTESVRYNPGQSHLRTCTRGVRYRCPETCIRHMRHRCAGTCIRRVETPLYWDARFCTERRGRYIRYIRFSVSTSVTESSYIRYIRYSHGYSGRVTQRSRSERLYGVARAATAVEHRSRPTASSCLQAPPRALCGAHPCARPRHGRARLLLCQLRPRGSRRAHSLRKLRGYRRHRPRRGRAFRRARARPPSRPPASSSCSAAVAAGVRRHAPFAYTRSCRSARCVAGAGLAASVSESDESTAFSLGMRARACFGARERTRLLRRQHAGHAAPRGDFAHGTRPCHSARASRLALATGLGAHHGSRREAGTRRNGAGPPTRQVLKSTLFGYS